MAYMLLLTSQFNILLFHVLTPVSVVPLFLTLTLCFVQKSAVIKNYFHLSVFHSNDKLLLDLPNRDRFHSVYKKMKIMIIKKDPFNFSLTL